MPNLTLRVVSSYVNGYGQTVATNTATVAVNEDLQFNEAIAASAVNEYHAVTIVRASLKGLCITASAPCTVKTNSAIAPADTINFTAPAGQPAGTPPAPIILSGAAAVAFFSADVTGTYTTNPSTAPINLVIDYASVV